MVKTSTWTGKETHLKFVETKDHYVVSGETDSDLDDLVVDQGRSKLLKENVHVRTSGYIGNRDKRCGNGLYVSATVFAFILLIALIFCGGYLTGYMTVDKVKTWMSGSKLYKRTEPWRRNIPDYGTESCVRLVDADGDGLDDVIIGLALGKGVSDMVTKKTMSDFCHRNGMELPCAGAILALRGYDGKELWRLNAYSEIFAFNCHGIDVNKDGHDECIATGRLGTIIAVDIFNGKFLWEGRDEHYRRDWNIYSPAIVQDLDHDGVSEIVIAHGGDPTVPAEQIKMNVANEANLNSF